MVQQRDAPRSFPRRSPRAPAVHSNSSRAIGPRMAAASSLVRLFAKVQGLQGPTKRFELAQQTCRMCKKLGVSQKANRLR